MDDLSKFESDLWEAADNLRANSKLTSSDYFMPVLGIIFLRHAANRFDTATRQIADDQAAGKMPQRKVQAADYIRRRALFLPEVARFDVIMSKATSDRAGLPKLVTDAMTAIEEHFEPLSGVLPKDYGIFEPKVLEELMRLFNSEQIKRATGDVFGRIYEYFLAKFSIQKAHDNGEFFTPSSLVQLIVNLIEPDHGTIFDPACGSGGMFVQSSHFIEHEGGDTTRKVVFYGQEKNRDTIRIAKMNLAVHGLEGKIAEAITYYQDEHSLAGKCDFVMANPPFNVDLVDAERIKNDPRLPFGLPGVNKEKRVSNGNYLWISYFWSYLSKQGRAGFVMSSQASSAGNDEKTVRQKLVESGDVDVMISIKGGFFYTRTVPCELWFFDRTKPSPSPPAPPPEGEGRKIRHYRGGYDFSGLLEKARELRKNQTQAEELLWQLVRNRQLADMKFRRQHQIGDYIADFYCDERKVVIELDGAIHDEPSKAKHDAKRQKYLESLGLKVLRFPNKQVLEHTQSVLESIADSCSPSTPGSPSTSGRGDRGEGDVAPNQRGNILMLDARSIGQLMKGSRKVHEFTPEQMCNLTAIVWLYRGQTERFRALVRTHLDSALQASHECFQKDLTEPLDRILRSFAALHEKLRPFLDSVEGAAPENEIIADYLALQGGPENAVEAFRLVIDDAQRDFNEAMGDASWKRTLDLHENVIAPLAEYSRTVVTSFDHFYKTAARVVALSDQVEDPGWKPREIRSALKSADSARHEAIESLRRVRYLQRQAAWLIERFPEARFQSVPGLCKVVTRSEIAEADWSLTPGRFVGVAPATVDEDFDFEQAMREIHEELAGLNAEAIELAATIQANLEGLGV